MTNQLVKPTASDRVKNLSQSIKKGLHLGKQYVVLLDKLAGTDNQDELLSSMQELAKFDLENSFVKFPQHYQKADYYLLFMYRLLNMNQVSGVSLHEEINDHSLSMQMDNIGDKLKFKFELDSEHGGAFFAEQNNHEPLFYIDLEKKALRFANRSLVNFFIVRGLKKFSDLDLAAAIKPLIAFAHILKEELDFFIDLGILNPSNDFHAKLAQPELDLQVIDKLFVKTADADYMLLNLPKNNGAQLGLEHHVTLILGFDPDDYAKQWYFRVTDPDQQVSFFDVLLHYSLIRDWYLSNRSALAIMTEPLVLTD